MNTQQYFKEIEKKTKEVYAVAEKARSKGFDPVDKVEIPLARSLAEKVVGLMATIYPQMIDSGIIERIIELEKKFGKLDPAICLQIAEEIAKQKFCKFATLKEAIEAGARTGIAYITLGVVSSPIEGLTEIKIVKTKEGKEYFSPYFSGPIRSAGGSSAAFSLVIIDYLRELFGYAKYDPREEEIKRSAAELHDYHERITNLQYMPRDEETKFLARHLPLQVNGEPSEVIEVSNYKNLERIETNFVRGGFCLVMGEGIAQKAKKISKYISSLKKKGFKLSDWDFLEEYVKLHEKRDMGKTDASPTYIQDLVAGRPVFGHPSESGAFRFRYGRGRVSGFSAASIHPATMEITDGFIAIGTQLKIEKPTKGCIVTVCDSIDGPIVKLFNGTVRKVKTMEEAKALYSDVEEIIYIGDILFPFSDVTNRNFNLLKPGYVEEIWKLELREKNPGLEKGIDTWKIDFEKAVEISSKEKISLYPKYIFYWTEISKEEFLGLIEWLKYGKVSQKIILPYTKADQEKFSFGKRALELLGIEHEVTIEHVVINFENSRALLTNLGVDFEILKEEKNLREVMNDYEEKVKKVMISENLDNSDDKKDSILKIINSLSKFDIRDKAGDFIGARMGRPEKAKLRKLTGSPNVLFPVGSEGGRLRSFQSALENGSVASAFPIFYCEECRRETIYRACETCGSKTRKMFYCHECGKTSEERCKEHRMSVSYYNKALDINYYFEKAKEKLGLSNGEIPPLIKGVRGTSSEGHIVEHLSKGILRAMFDLQVNKDGTIRFDATEMPLVSFKPKEINVSIEKLKEIGYDKDIYGEDLTREDQILELMPHDILLPSSPESPDGRADDIFMRICHFIDDMLVKFYDMKPMYNVRKREDLVGKLGVCIAPHNCAGVVCRIIGFSNTLGMFASPFMHAAIRRDCLGFDNYVSVKKNGRWHIEKIGEFIENIKPSQKVDNFGTLMEKMQDTFTWSNPGQEEVKEITKHRPSNMIKIFLEDGRKIELTENHKVYLKDKKEKRAAELNIGDKLTVSYKREIETNEINEFFLPEIFKNRNDIMLRNIRNYLGKFENLNKSHNFYQRDSFPIKFVEEFLNKYGKGLRDLPAEARIAVKRDNVELPLIIKLSNDFFELIGLYIAEGYARSIKGKKGLNQVYIASNDKRIRDFIKETVQKYFGLKPSEKKEDRVTFSSRILYELFSDYFKLGKNAKEKRIPSLFLNLKKEKLAALLRGYFEGDGSVSVTDNRVTCDTVSEGLKYDLSFVLSRFDIFTKFYEYEKQPGPQLREFYINKKRDPPKFKITKIIIPSNFTKKFNQIGFISDRKNKILKEITKKIPIGMRIDSDENYVYPKITKIESVGENVSYCLNVPSEHNFFSNDILVHNCDGDEAAIMLLGDVLLNFSREFIPQHRGGTQDCPLVLNARIDAGEVDDQIMDFEFVNEYPLELYRLAEQRKHSSEIHVRDVRTVLKEGKDPFAGLMFTHNTENFNEGVACSSYKLLETMQDKVKHQMELVEKIRAANTSETARLIIERHFLKDLRGNLRKFSMQDFRCVACNEIMRRSPLSGVCQKCSGKIIFTTHEGGIKKYLEPALELAKKYNLSPYIRQSLELTKRHIDSIFGKEIESQENLGKWF